VSDEKHLLRTTHLTKSFGQLTALRALDLTLSSGEFLTLFGRNGAGKSTFLKICSTLIRSYSGEVLLFGEDLKRADEKLRRRIGFVSHESFLYQDLSVFDNLMFYARLYRVGNLDSRIEQMIVSMDLEAKTATPVRALSRGMKQRLSLGRAFLHEPELLFLDEPFTGLDERASELLHERFSEFKRKGGAVIMATHNLEHGWRHADRVTVIDRGSIAYESPAGDTTYEEFRGRYRDILSH
jgi:heme exporter protein A